MWAGHSRTPSSPARAPMELDRKAGERTLSEASPVPFHLPLLSPSITSSHFWWRQWTKCPSL